MVVRSSSVQLSSDDMQPLSRSHAHVAKVYVNLRETGPLEFWMYRIKKKNISSRKLLMGPSSRGLEDMFKAICLMQLKSVN